jgi:hypothetical protein
MATTLLVVGDVAGHLTALDEVLAPFDVCVSESEVPAGTVVVQVGDLIGRSDESARLIACVDRLHNRAPDRWVQLVGNHESRGPLRHRPGAAARRRSHRRSPDHGHRPRPGQGWASVDRNGAGHRPRARRADGQDPRLRRDARFRDRRSGAQRPCMAATRGRELPVRARVSGVEPGLGPARRWPKSCPSSCPSRERNRMRRTGLPARAQRSDQPFRVSLRATRHVQRVS